MIIFEWDQNKNVINKRKHGICFEEAQSIFYDERALLISDPDHSISEERFVMLGMSNKLRILVVCHCLRNNEVIRIIMARKAIKKEINQYYEVLK